MEPWEQVPWREKQTERLSIAVKIYKMQIAADKDVSVGFSCSLIIHLAVSMESFLSYQQKREKLETQKMAVEAQRAAGRRFFV